jgi:hypothetical protein
MKRILIFFIAIVFSCSLAAQDLIVTSGLDSINCKIIRVDQDNIYYSLGGHESVIALIRVKSCLYNYYLQKLPKVEPIPDQEEIVPEPESTSDEGSLHKRFRFAINSGYSYRTYKISEGLSTDVKEYYNKLRWGFNASVNATYFISNTRGIGLKISAFKTSNELDSVWIFQNGFLTTGKIGDDITILYIGPTFTTKILGDQDWNLLLFTASLGYTRYINDKVSISNYKITGGTLGFSLEVSYDRAISEKLTLGIQASLNGGTLSKISLEDASGSTSYSWNESLVRFDLGIGIRF